MDKSQRQTFWLKLYFPLKIFRFFFTLPLRSWLSCDKYDTLVWNYALIKAPTFNCSFKGFEIFGWWWTSIPIWQVSSLFNLQHFHIKLRQTLYTCGQDKAGVCVSCLPIFKRSNKLETCQILFVSVCLKKELLQPKCVKKKLCMERQIAQPARPLQGWQGW